MLFASAASNAKQIKQQLLPSVVWHRVIAANNIRGNDRTGAFWRVTMLTMNKPVHRIHSTSAICRVITVPPAQMIRPRNDAVHAPISTVKSQHLSSIWLWLLERGVYGFFRRIARIAFAAIAGAVFERQSRTKIRTLTKTMQASSAS